MVYLYARRTTGWLWFWTSLALIPLVLLMEPGLYYRFFKLHLCTGFGAHYIFVSPFISLAQTGMSFQENPVELKTENGVIKVALMIPANKIATTVVLIISGSGPTDQDCNNLMMKNNHFKLLAEHLAKWVLLIF